MAALLEDRFHRRDLDVRFLSAEDVGRLGPTPSEVIGAIEEARRAQGMGEVVLEPRVHPEPDESFGGYWNVLRAFVVPLGAAVLLDSSFDCDEIRVTRGLATCDVALGTFLVQRAAERGIGTVLRYR